MTQKNWTSFMNDLLYRAETCFECSYSNVLIFCPGSSLRVKNQNTRDKECAQSAALSHQLFENLICTVQ